MKVSIIMLLAMVTAIYTKGYYDAYSALSTQINQDLSNVLTEEQYKKIPVRTMIMMKDIELVR